MGEHQRSVGRGSIVLVSAPAGRALGCGLAAKGPARGHYLTAPRVDDVPRGGALDATSAWRGHLALQARRASGPRHPARDERFRVMGCGAGRRRGALRELRAGGGVGYRRPAVPLAIPGLHARTAARGVGTFGGSRARGNPQRRRRLRAAVRGFDSVRAGRRAHHVGRHDAAGSFRVGSARAAAVLLRGVAEALARAALRILRIDSRVWTDRSRGRSHVDAPGPPESGRGRSRRRGHGRHGVHRADAGKEIRRDATQAGGTALIRGARPQGHFRVFIACGRKGPSSCRRTHRVRRRRIRGRGPAARC